MRSLEQLDRWIAGKVKSWTSHVPGVTHSKELLEIRREILEDVRDQIEPKGEGKCLFPYNAVAIHVAGHEAAFSELPEDIEALLKEANCSIPSGWTVTVEVDDDSAPFRIDYSNHKAEVVVPAGRPALKLTISRGQAEAPEYIFDYERVNIGRLKEVVGEKDGLRRRNDVVFAETETTVSREHAQIRYDVETGKFRLYDSGSQRGTAVFRSGRRLDAPRARGVQLQPGDEIHIGDARIKFELAP